MLCNALVIDYIKVKFKDVVIEIIDVDTHLENAIGVRYTSLNGATTDSNVVYILLVDLIGFAYNKINKL